MEISYDFTEKFFWRKDPCHLFGGGYKKPAVSNYRLSKEYNKMASLFFNYVYLAGADQTTTLTVTGEEQTGPTGVTGAEQTISISVPKAQMDLLMDVGVQGTTGSGYPEVTLDWTQLASSTDPIWTSFATAGATATTFLDGKGTVQKTLQSVFATESFSFVTNAASAFLSIPPEAISNVDVSAAIAFKRGATTLLANVMGGLTTTILDEAITAQAGVLYGDSKKEAVRGLFLQALAAGRYQQSGSPAPEGSDLPQNASPGFNFQVGDMVVVYTELTLKKTRSFIPDINDALEGAGGMKFKVDGSNVIVDNSGDETVESDNKMWRVRWELSVVA